MEGLHSHQPKSLLFQVLQKSKMENNAGANESEHMASNWDITVLYNETVAQAEGKSYEDTVSEVSL